MLSPPTQPAVGDGSSSNPYKITKASELYWFAATVNGGIAGITQKADACATLASDITINENVLQSDGTLNGDGSELTAWTPMGSKLVPYKGTFDGAGYAIKGLYFNDIEKDYVGLFGCISGGAIQNITVADSYFVGNSYVGGVCGYNYSSGTITGCTNGSTVTGAVYVGGVCGGNVCTTSFLCKIISCTNSGVVNGVLGTKYNYNTSNVGGVCGYNNQGRIQFCTNSGTITGHVVGGLSGRNEGDIRYCANTGAIIAMGMTETDAGSYIGGLSGMNGFLLMNCYSNGTITTTSDLGKAGGLCGYNMDNSSEIANCYYNSTVCDIEKAVGSGFYRFVQYATGKTAEEFESGELAWLLNGTVNWTISSNGSPSNVKWTKTDPPVWFQNLAAGGDAYPVLQSTGDNTVYQGKAYDDDGVLGNTYANTEFTAGAVSNVPYLDADGTKRTVDCTEVPTGATVLGESGKTTWYVVSNNVTAGGRITIQGDVKLILADGFKLDASNGGIEVPFDGYTSDSITVYAQSTGENMGKLVAVGQDGDSGIGGGNYETTNSKFTGKIAIVGGKVDATGGSNAAGIGGGSGVASTSVTIKGGIVNATGGTDGAGIGGGKTGDGGNISISGGTVTAIGNGGAVGIGRGSFGGSTGTFSTGTSGNAYITTNSIRDQSGKDNWRGIIQVGDDVTVGGSQTLPADLTNVAGTITVNSGAALTIPEGQTLTIDDGAKLANNGNVTVNGTLTINGDGEGSTGSSLTKAEGGTVNKKAQSTAPAAPTKDSATNSSVTLAAMTGGKAGVEYGHSATQTAPTTWQTGTAFAGLSEGTGYYFYARYAGNDYYAASDASEAAAISTGGTPALSGITVKTNPTKTTYTYGEAFDASGLVLTLTYGNGSTGEVAYSTGNAGDFSFAPTTLTVETTSVTVTYASKTASIEVTVNKAEVTVPTIEHKTYSGSAQTATVATSDKYTVTTNNGGTDASNYEVVLTLDDSADYAWASGDTNNDGKITLTFTIDPLDVTGATVGAFDALTYTGSAQTPAATVTKNSQTATGTWNNVTNVADKTTFTANGNFTGTIVDQATGMTAMNITGATVGAFGALTYTGNAQTPAATVTKNSLTVSGTWSDVTNVSDKTTFTASGNFTGTIVGQATGMAKKVVDAFTLDSLVTAPVKNAAPVTTMPAQAQYTGSVSWSGTPTKFLGNTAYTATVTLAPTANYTFAGLAANTFTYGGATATNAKDSGTVTIVFPVTEDRNVTGVTTAGTPTKTVYNIGETFEPAGLTINVKYDDGTTQAFTQTTGYAGFSANPAAMAATTTSVKLTYGGVDCGNIAVSVRENLTSVTAPAAITNVLNGTEKTAAALGLPTTVAIATSTGATATANVVWNVTDSIYDPAALEEKDFTVTGTVTLPNDMSNVNGAALTTQVRVDVKAIAIIAKPVQNTAPDTPENITGIKELDQVVVGTKLTITADEFVRGDKTYIPVAWSTNPKGTFARTGGIVYSTVVDTTGMTVGEHTFTVTYRELTTAGRAATGNGVQTVIPYTTKGPALAPSSTSTPTSTTTQAATPNTEATSEKVEINAWVTTGGTISPIGVRTYTQGQSQTYTITPAAGYRIVKVTVDGVDVGAVSSYTFNNLSRNHQIGAYFDKATGAAVTGSVVPATGDDAPIVLCEVLMMAAMLGMCGVFMVRRKEKY